MNSDQLDQIEKSKNAIIIINKILPHLPDYGVFDFSSFAKEILLWTPQEIREISTVKEHIIHLALNQFQYIKEKTRNSYYELSDKGREAKQKGGHFSHLEYLEEKKKLEAERLERKDKSDKIDLLNKHWQYKTKLLPYIVSGLALTVSIISYFKPEKKQLDLLPMQEKIQVFQDSLQLLDSLFRVDNLLKKGNR